jgi:hypothetical protein
VLGGFACNTDFTAPVSSDVQLTAEEVAVTEVWLKVHIEQKVLHDSIRVTRNDTSILALRFRGTDTLIIDDRLLPKQTYKYKLFSFGTSLPYVSSEVLTITTMDTTSHEFIWEVDTLGEGNSSILFDVTIINDTLAYAVGELYLKDSTGLFDPTMYNFARWDGTVWTLSRIYYAYDGGQFISRLRSIFAFHQNDIWVGSTQPMHWNGVRWEQYDLTASTFNGYITKISGRSSDYPYIVGSNGAMAHYNGSSWQKIDTRTSLDIQDIWGDHNEKTGDWEMLAVAGNYFISNERKILRVAGSYVTTLSDNGIGFALNGIWFSPGKHYWAVGAGIYQKHFTLSAPFWEGGLNIPITTYTTNRIRGNEVNDVFFVGAYGDCFHFNGATWRSYRAETKLVDGAYYSVATKGNTVIAVGEKNPRAVVARGVRTLSTGVR